MRVVDGDELVVGAAAVKVVVPFTFAGRRGSGIFSARPADGDLGLAFEQLVGASLASFEQTDQEVLIGGLHDAAMAAVGASVDPDGMELS